MSYWLFLPGLLWSALAERRPVAHGRLGWLWTACLSMLAGAGMFLLVTPRPQDLSYLFFSGLLLLLTLARQRTVWLGPCRRCYLSGPTSMAVSCWASPLSASS